MSQFMPGGGYPPGGGGGGYDLVAQMRAEIGALRRDFEQRFGGVAQHLRRRDDVLDQAARRLGEISAAVDVLKSTRFGIDDSPGMTRIENIPGRRVPFTFLVDIPVGANTTSIQQGSLTVSQEGPFVAVRRMATFQSAYEFQINAISGISTGPARYAGRSFGRFRPVHSAWDILDAQTQQNISFASQYALGSDSSACASDGFPAWTSAASSFRTMEFDGRIAVINAGSSYPRQNIPVPTTFWSSAINAPQDLGCLDFFERGEVITFQVSPTHVNNPPAGNADGPTMFGAGQYGFGSPVGWPFLAGQYDPHEGIVTPRAICFTGGTTEDPVPVTAAEDPIVRLPDGILTLGFEGYRIIQPVAV